MRSAAVREKVDDEAGHNCWAQSPNLIETSMRSPTSQLLGPDSGVTPYSPEIQLAMASKERRPRAKRTRSRHTVGNTAGPAATFAAQSAIYAAIPECVVR